MSVTIVAPDLEAPARPVKDSRPGPREVTGLWIAIILLGHGLYGIVLARSAVLATIHAGATFAIALWAALSSSMRRIAIACAYMAGSEILWRLGRAKLPWEFVKYATVVLMLVALARVVRLKWDWPAVTYFALLIPSTLYSFATQPFEFARQQVSFNLSGPLLLATSTWFFAQLRPTRPDIQRMFLALLAPIVSLGFIAITRTASLDDLQFSDTSNFQTSAGYGPNQVSTVFGFGVLVALLLAILVESRTRERLIYVLFALVLGVLSALTFSRGGLFGAVGALAIAAPMMFKGAKNRVTLLVVALGIVGIVQLVILPRLDALTEGALAARFQDTDPTGRDVLIKNELEAFTEHPFFGTGPAVLDDFGAIQTSTHTEFSRLPAQHGIFGVVALGLMALIALRDITGQRSTAAKAISIALIMWSVLTMGHAAMRIALTPLAFGMAAALFLSQRPSPAPSPQTAR
jgi:hypothetical protein